MKSKSVYNISIRKETYYNQTIKILPPPLNQTRNKSPIPNFKFKALKSKLKLNTKASDLVPY